MKYRYLVLFLFSSMNAMDYGKHKIVGRTNKPKEDSPLVKMKKKVRKKTSEDLSTKLISIADKIRKLNQKESVLKREISAIERERGYWEIKLSKVSVELQQSQITDSDAYAAGKVGVSVVLQRLYDEAYDGDTEADTEKEDDEN